MSSTTRKTSRLIAALLLVGGASGCSARTEAYRRLQAEATESAPRVALTRLEAPLSASAPVAGALHETRPPFAGQAELSLAALRQEVLDRNPSLAAMHSTWQAAIARYPQVTAVDDPQFGYAVAPGTVGSDDVNFGQKFEFSQRFPWPGKLGLRGDAALSQAEAARHDFEATRQILVEATESAFYEYYFVHRAIEINRVNQELLLELRRIAERRYGAGLVHKQDALQAEVEHQHLVHRGIVLERARTVTAARLNTLLNVPPESPLPPPPAALGQVRGLPPRSFLSAYALEHRPELSALASRTRAHEAEVALAKREYYPDLAVTGGYNSLWDAEERRPIVGFGFNVPLQLGRRTAALAEAEAKKRQAIAELQQQRAKVLFEVSSAADEVNEKAHVVHLYASSIVPASEESLAAARSGYATGTNDFLTLVAAEKALMLARLSYEEALAQYHQGRARLEKAIGGPFSTLETQP